MIYHWTVPPLKTKYTCVNGEFRFLKSLWCSSSWRQGDSATISATPFVQLDMGHHQSVLAENKRSHVPLKALMKKRPYFRILLYLRAEGFGMYQSTENISRNLSVMSLNANRWREVVCVKGYWMCIMTWNATAVTECRNAETWKCCCPRLEKTREMSVVMFLMFEVALGLNIGRPLLSSLLYYIVSNWRQQQDLFLTYFLVSVSVTVTADLFTKGLTPKGH